uniref:discoidin domain-containing protein n=1 Tax=Treponema sp. TaxID=166 RepID=UPI0025DE8CE7
LMVPVQRGKIVSYQGDTSLSSTASTSCNAYYAVDGNMQASNFYRGSDYNFDFVVNLGDTYSINGVDISFYTLQGSEAYCTYNIYGKAQASDSWSLIKDCSDNVMMNFNTQVFDSTETAYKYIMIDVISEKRATTNGSNAPHSTVNGSWCTGFYEVQVYGQ